MLHVVILLLYVDDIIITGSNDDLIQSVITDLSAIFDMKDMGALTYFLGLQIEYHSNGIFISKKKYATDLVSKAGMTSCNSCPTPHVPHSQLLEHEGELLSDPTLYRSIVGALQYLTFTRPDISFAVNHACQFLHAPTEAHLASVKRIIRYLQGTLGFGLTYSRGDTEIIAYSDSDWGGDHNTGRSTTGFIVYLGHNPVSWCAKKQAAVSRSSTEAEYWALANTAAEVSWIQQVMCDLHVFIPSPPLIYCDNLSSIALGSNAVFHSKIKSLETDYHYVRERVQNGSLILQYIPTQEQTADILTKGLHGPLFNAHVGKLRLGNLSCV